MHQEEAFKFCLDTKNNEALPLDLAYPKHLSVCSPTVLPYESVQIYLGTFLCTTNDNFSSYYVLI
jgi:hypothetical protein